VVAAGCCRVDKRGVRQAVQWCVRHLPTVVAALALAASAAPARADDARPPAAAPVPADDDFPVQPTGSLAVDAGLVLALPATWQTGLSSGIGAGVTRGRRFAWGVRGSWSTATESSLVWTVSHDDFRLRAIAALQQPAGRGVFALRLGLGPTFVYEHRTRNLGARAGNWIMIRAKGTKSNGFGLGATVTIETTEGRQVREINNTASYVSSNDIRLHAGLGAAKIIRQIEILWPSGTRQVLKDVAVNQVLVIEEP